MLWHHVVGEMIALTWRDLNTAERTVHFPGGVKAQERTLSISDDLASVSDSKLGACGIQANGSAYCWGTNFFEEGNPSLQYYTPTLITGVP